MTLRERADAVKNEFFEELRQILQDYDIERIIWDETYEISPEADAKIDELLEYNEEWYEEFFAPYHESLWQKIHKGKHDD